MKRFVELFTELDESNRTRDKIVALRDYFASEPPACCAWALFFLSGKRLAAPLKTRLLREWAAQLSGLPDWLVRETYDRVGDLAETLALLLPDVEGADLAELPLDTFIERHVLALRDWDAPIQFQMVRAAWAGLDARSRFVYNKLITGGFRVGVSRRLVVRALAEVTHIEPAVMEHRLLGNWQPSPEAYAQLLSADAADAPARPYPFYLASPLDGPLEALGPISDWRAEWKWDGIRVQLIHRQGILLLWSRGEAILNESFPEISEAATRLPDGCVLDGEILCWAEGQPLPFAVLQTRLGRKRVNREVLQQAPATFLAYDCLEARGVDLRKEALESRLNQLEAMVEQHAGGSIRLAPPLAAGSWAELGKHRDASRLHRVEGIMLKRRGSPYRVGRVRGDWWKWKIEPYSVDAVLMYAQAGHGRRAGLFTDYTFGVWEGSELVPLAKAYSGLNDAEIRALDDWIKKHTTGRSGPVRLVAHAHVFELHFEGIAESKRHRSGIALRFPRIARWRKDKPIGEADSLASVRQLLPPPGKS